MSRHATINGGLAAVLALGLAACGVATAGTRSVGSSPVGGTDGAAGMCAQEQPDCIDTPELLDDERVTVDETGMEQFRRDAQSYLGVRRDDLPDVVRVSRIGTEQRMLTQDHQVGRITVELDDLGNGPVVTRATVELPDGSETFELAP